MRAVWLIVLSVFAIKNLFTMAPITVTELSQVNFSALTLEEKINVKRGTLALDITQRAVSNKKVYKRRFNIDTYNKYSWLCGCTNTRKLYCFPCILFGGDAAWTQKGIDDMKKLLEKCAKHAMSTTHLNNTMSHALLGNVNIRNELGSAYQRSIVEFNLKVDKNREILSKIIDCVK